MDTALKPTQRILQISNGNIDLQNLIYKMLDISEAGLPLMFDKGKKTFYFTRKKQSEGTTSPLGESFRYGAITLLALSHLNADKQKKILCGNSPEEFLDMMLESLNSNTNLGDAALTVWAACSHKHPKSRKGVDALRQIISKTDRIYTVEGAWALSAFSSTAGLVDTSRDAAKICTKLLDVFSFQSGIFPHELSLQKVPWYRKHVGCFADQVYPIQGLALYHRAYDDKKALDASSRCAEQICKLQGKDGQWWWHYDSRMGNVIEGYPVYTVHQDSMAPMALLDLKDAGGPDLSDAIRRGLAWMKLSPEIGKTLIDEHEVLIWRKVARKEPRKFTRSVRAITTRIHPTWRIPWMDSLFPATEIDFEDRPYHLGWVIHTWMKN
jgi:hypothetical protein